MEPLSDVIGDKHQVLLIQVNPVNDPLSRGIVEVLSRHGYRADHLDLSSLFAAPLESVSGRSRALMNALVQLLDAQSAAPSDHVFISPGLMLTHLALALHRSTDAINNFPLPSAMYRLLCRTETVLFLESATFSLETIGPLYVQYYGADSAGDTRRQTAVLERLKRLVGELSARGARIQHLDAPWEAARHIMDRLSVSRVAESQMRVQILDGRFLSDQMEPLIRLFERYANVVEGLPLKVDSLRVAAGTLFVFRLPGGAGDPIDLTPVIERFDAVMTLCRTRPIDAMSHLVARELTPASAAAQTKRFIRQFGRIMLDIADDFDVRRQSFMRVIGPDTLATRRRLRKQPDRVELSAGVASASLSAMLLATSRTPPVAVRVHTGEDVNLVRDVAAQFFGVAGANTIVEGVEPFNTHVEADFSLLPADSMAALQTR